MEATSLTDGESMLKRYLFPVQKIEILFKDETIVGKPHKWICIAIGVRKHAVNPFVFFLIIFHALNLVTIEILWCYIKTK